MSQRKSGWLAAAWEALSQTGLTEIAFRIGTHILLIASILFVALGLRFFYSVALVLPLPIRIDQRTAPLPSPTAISRVLQLPSLDHSSLAAFEGVARRASLHTDLPSRRRFETLQYTVQDGESVLSVAVKFGLQPETILWANQSSLGDNPHSIRPGMVLTILPVDGAYHRWSPGDDLSSVAAFFNVKPEAILSFPGNQIKPLQVGDLTNPSIPAGTWLVIPGGTRDYVTWKVPEIPRDDPEAAKILGAGTCELSGDSPVGSGNFIWPSDLHYLSGYDYLPNANHPGIDVAVDPGNPVYAVDSGVVVYAGWNFWGYGNMVVVNHGNGWQTLYANLSDLYVVCGQTVWQGGVIGVIHPTSSASTQDPALPTGTPPAPTDSFLHFEMMFEGDLANPLDYLP